jgi:hypothetical protein
MSDNLIDPVFSDQVIWNGPDIPCLKICKGQKLSAIIANLAAKVCQVLSPYDLSSLTLDCALEIFGQLEPVERTITSVFQILLDNDCGLKDLIDNLQAQIYSQEEDVFTIDLKCLAQTDSFGSPLPVDRDSTIQLLLNEICNIKPTLVYLTTKVTDLQNQIDNLNLTPVITEVSVTTCIEPTSFPVSTQLKKVAADYCNFKSAIGSINDISTTRSQFPDGLLSKFGEYEGWIPIPQNYMQEQNNMYIIIEYLLNQVTDLQACCDKGCDNIKIGFGIDSTDNGMILTFSSLYGTSIPVGYTNTESILSIVEEGTNYTSNAYFIITNGYVTPEISLSGFQKGKTLTLSLNSTFTNGTVTCQKTVIKTWKFLSTGCCSITNLDSTPSILIYETTINGGE